MSNNFKEGDVVQLKSGSPALTVVGFTDRGKVTVRWFEDKEGAFKHDYLESSALEIMPEFAS